MKRFDDLPPDQQAVLRLLLRDQGASYDEIARRLRMAPAAVRDRAHEAVHALAPHDEAIGPARRTALADYLLGQQDPGTALETHGALERSAQERRWALAASAVLSDLADRPLPEVPGEPAGSVQSALLDDDVERGGFARTRRPSSRRSGAALLAVLTLAGVLVGGIFIGRATKDSGGAGSSTKAKRTTSTDATTRVDGQANLDPPAGSSVPKGKGVAQFVTSQGQRGIVVRVQGMAVISKQAGYPLWLTGSGRTPVLLGYVQGISAKGEAQVIGQLEVDPRNYERVLLSEKTTATPKAPGAAVLEGPIAFAAAG
ncbi:unannotated protein [freshwater metagenome]|uniref:Unannotated protein n=1 Tax=freshwater metagenome TaxID=449393 RepID=A0A6J7DQC4_9ZZZZ|nr:hypothetical protein [Actinomycetota bacterium]